MTGESQSRQSDTPDFWIAYYPDWSGAAVFVTELDALRYAVERPSMLVMGALVGQDLVHPE